MTLETDNAEERQARLERTMAEFRSAQQRRLVKQGIALWSRSEAALHSAIARFPVLLPKQPN